MPKRPDNLETVLLALELLRRIPRRGQISAPELHEQIEAAGLKRDLRTIQRQLEVLSAHFAIDRDDSSKPFTYRWKEQSAGLSLTSLTEQESLLLLLAKRHLEALLPARLTKSMDGFFRQATSRLLDPTQRKLERQWLDKVRIVSVTQPLLPPPIEEGVFEQVSEALYANRWLNVHYRNAAGKDTIADVMPLGLVQQGPRVYLVCRFNGHKQERSLALHRMKTAEARSHTFDRPTEFDLARYDADGQFGFGDGKSIRLHFNITRDAGQHLLESALSADQKVQMRDDHMRVSATVIESAQLTWWLQSFGSEVWGVRRNRVTSP